MGIHTALTGLVTTELGIYRNAMILPLIGFIVNVLKKSLDHWKEETHKINAQAKKV